MNLNNLPDPVFIIILIRMVAKIAIATIRALIPLDHGQDKATSTKSYPKERAAFLSSPCNTPSRFTKANSHSDGRTGLKLILTDYQLNITKFYTKIYTQHTLKLFNLHPTPTFQFL